MSKMYHADSKGSKHPLRQPITIMKCGNSVGSYPLLLNQRSVAINGPIPGPGYGCDPTILASVALDTRSLVDPTIKLNFSSLISTRTNQVFYYLRLRFTLRRICDGQPIELGSWLFEHCELGDDLVTQQVFGELETETFSFEHCECGVCSDCCYYQVDVTPEPGYGGFEYAIISKIALNATAVGMPA